MTDRPPSSIEPVQPRESSIPGVPERRIRISYETMDRWAQERKRLEAEVERLRAALRQAEIRLFQIDRDRRERDKVFATAATARAEIARALDEGENDRG